MGLSLPTSGLGFKMVYTCHIIKQIISKYSVNMSIINSRKELENFIYRLYKVQGNVTE